MQYENEYTRSGHPIGRCDKGTLPIMATSDTFEFNSIYWFK